MKCRRNIGTDHSLGDSSDFCNQYIVLLFVGVCM